MARGNDNAPAPNAAAATLTMLLRTEPGLRNPPRVSHSAADSLCAGKYGLEEGFLRPWRSGIAEVAGDGVSLGEGLGVGIGLGVQLPTPHRRIGTKFGM
mmetsp:Transcript_85076/g.259919  ORF Transcript_85076/g.259919 Transcript_85076/m.259919 type:complete len:99 (+) Transcript_85076:1299-1595(+)